MKRFLPAGFFPFYLQRPKRFGRGKRFLFQVENPAVQPTESFPPERSASFSAAGPKRFIRPGVDWLTPARAERSASVSLIHKRGSASPPKRAERKRFLLEALPAGNFLGQGSERSASGWKDVKDRSAPLGAGQFGNRSASSWKVFTAEGWKLGRSAYRCGLFWGSASFSADRRQRSASVRAKEKYLPAEALRRFEIWPCRFKSCRARSASVEREKRFPFSQM